MQLSPSHPALSPFIAIAICYRHFMIYAGGMSPGEAGAIISRREDFTLAAHSVPNSRSAAVTGAGGKFGREVAVQLVRMSYRVLGIARNDEDIAEVEALSGDANSQHRGSSAQRDAGADRRHRHLLDRRAHPHSGLIDPAASHPPATRGQASWSLWAGPSTTWLPRNSICAITIRDSRPTRTRSAP